MVRRAWGASRAMSPLVLGLAVLLAGPQTSHAGLPQAEAFVAEGRFIDALMALNVVLAEETRSPRHEEAIWLAERLCSRIASSSELLERYMDSYGMPVTEPVGAGVDQRAFSRWGFIDALNVVGAGFRWNEIAGSFQYEQAFARRTLAEYPDTARRAAAEYRVIRPGRNEPDAIHRWRREIVAYLDRHGDDSAPEVAIAHSTLGAVYEGLWAALATGEAFDAGHEASAYADPPATDDESVAVRAEEYRLEAIRHYAEFLLSAVSSYAYSESSRVASRLRALRRREADGPGILCYD